MDLDVIPFDSSTSSNFFIDSIVSLNIIMGSKGCFCTILTANSNLFCAELSNSFLFLTFSNHNFANFALYPPLNKKTEILFGSNTPSFRDRKDIFLEVSTYIFFSDSVKSTGTDTNCGFGCFSFVYSALFRFSKVYRHGYNLWLG